MAVKRKISVRKILQMVTTIVVTVCCIIAITSSAKIEGQKTVDHIEVHINSGKKYHFIEEKQILDETINNRNIDVMHTPLNKLDVQSMEHILRADPWVADASLYVDAARTLHISVTQRIPIARLFQQNGTSCYMDNTLSIMPLAPNFIFYTSVVTNVPVLTNDSTSTSVKSKIATLIRRIQLDSFWNAQVSQVIVDSDCSFQLVPVLGQQRIVFGDTSHMREKFSNLRSFYTNVLNRIGWDKYETLDVRFKNQVVASPSLPYKGPVDKAAPTMNWITSITQTEARIDSMHAQKEDAKAAPKEEPAIKLQTPVGATPAKAPEKKGYKKAPAAVVSPKNKLAEAKAKMPEKKEDKKPAANVAKSKAPENQAKQQGKTEEKKTDKKADKKQPPVTDKKTGKNKTEDKKTDKRPAANAKKEEKKSAKADKKEPKANEKQKGKETAKGDKKDVKKDDKKQEKAADKKTNKSDNKTNNKDNKKSDGKGEKVTPKKPVDNAGKTKDEQKPKYTLPEQKHN